MSDSIGYYQPVLALLCNINNNCYCFKREPDNVVPEFDVTLKKKNRMECVLILMLFYIAIGNEVYRHISKKLISDIPTKYNTQTCKSWCTT